jgi:hypothetical protein
MANGEVWPPVIFVKEQPPPPDLADGCYSDGDPEHFAYVQFVPSGAAPSNKQLERWLECMEHPMYNNLLGRNHVICDSASYHTNNEGRAIFAQHQITPYIIPAAAGKWVNPCDQAPHREMRRVFNRLQQQQPGNKIANIISAYYAVDERTIVNAFESCCLLKGNASKTIVAKASEGYTATASRRRQFAAYEQKYAEWCASHFDLAERLMQPVRKAAPHKPIGRANQRAARMVTRARSRTLMQS